MPAGSPPTAARARVPLPATVPRRPGPYAPRRAARPHESRGAAPALATWRRGTWRRLSFHMLLQSLDGMVVMHPRGPRRRAQRGSDLLVLEPLLRPQQKYFALQPRQLLQPFAQPPLRLGGNRPLVRVAIGRSQVVAQRHYATALGAAVRVLQHVAPDREQPGTKAALPAERGDGAKRTDERLLHHVIEIGLRRPRAREKTRQRSRVTPDQFGRRLLVPALPGGDQRRVGRAGDGGNGLRGRHALGTVDVRDQRKLRRWGG